MIEQISTQVVNVNESLSHLISIIVTIFLLPTVAFILFSEDKAIELTSPKPFNMDNCGDNSSVPSFEGPKLYYTDLRLFSSVRSPLPVFISHSLMFSVAAKDALILLSGEKARHGRP